MTIYIKCEKENLHVALDTDTKPSKGDNMVINKQEYVVTKVSWILETAPGTSGLLVLIERVNEKNNDSATIIRPTDHSPEGYLERRQQYTDNMEKFISQSK